jgi:hypothetical protein
MPPRPTLTRAMEAVEIPPPPHPRDSHSSHSPYDDQGDISNELAMGTFLSSLDTASLSQPVVSP